MKESFDNLKVYLPVEYKSDDKKDYSEDVNFEKGKAYIKLKDMDFHKGVFKYTFKGQERVVKQSEVPKTFDQVVKEGRIKLQATKYSEAPVTVESDTDLKIIPLFGILFYDKVIVYQATIDGKTMSVRNENVPKTGMIRTYTNVVKNKDGNKGLENLEIVVRDIGVNFAMEISRK